MNLLNNHIAKKHGEELDQIFLVTRVNSNIE